MFLIIYEANTSFCITSTCFYITIWRCDMEVNSDFKGQFNIFGRITFLCITSFSFDDIFRGFRLLVWTYSHISVRFVFLLTRLAMFNFSSYLNSEVAHFPTHYLISKICSFGYFSFNHHLLLCLFRCSNWLTCI